MKILIAPDKFKGSLSAQAVCIALSKGLKKNNPNLKIITLPMADGGDGSLEVLAHYFDLKTIEIAVHDPLWRPIKAAYKMAGTTAYIELSAASGLVLLKEEERNCMETSSVGTGELILDALRKGAKQIYLFIGGSATNDGGMGIAHALGFAFFAKNGDLLKPVGKNLRLIEEIDKEDLWFDLKGIKFKVICDVNNPFYGENGAAYVYAPQKGATSEEVKELDKGLRHLAKLLKAANYADIAAISGAGAAGGVGGGAIAFLGAELVAGIQTFITLTQLEAAIKDCDLVITGEGKLDSQTEQGKVISGVCELARKYDKRVIAVCGAADFPIPKLLGLQEVYTVLSKSESITEAMEKAAAKLELIGREIGTQFNEIKKGKGRGSKA